MYIFTEIFEFVCFYYVNQPFLKENLIFTEKRIVGYFVSIWLKHYNQPFQVVKAYTYLILDIESYKGGRWQNTGGALPPHPSLNLDKQGSGYTKLILKY